MDIAQDALPSGDDAADRSDTGSARHPDAEGAMTAAPPVLPPQPVTGAEDPGFLAGQLNLLAARLLGMAARVPAGPGALPDPEAALLGQELEHASRVLDGLKVGIAGDLGARFSAGRYAGSGASTMTDFLRTGLRISSRDAARRVRLTAAVLPVRDGITGEPMPVSLPLLAAAVDAGELGAEAATLVSSHVGQAADLCSGGRISAGKVAEVEAVLVEIGSRADPDYLSRCASRVINALDPYGKQPTEAELTAKEGIRFSRPRRGLIAFNGHMTILDYEELMTAIGTATNPRSAANRETVRKARIAEAAASGSVPAIPPAPPTEDSWPSVQAPEITSMVQPWPSGTGTGLEAGWPANSGAEEWQGWPARPEHEMSDWPKVPDPEPLVPPPAWPPTAGTCSGTGSLSDDGFKWPAGLVEPDPATSWDTRITATTGPPTGRDTDSPTGRFLNASANTLDGGAETPADDQRPPLQERDNGPDQDPGTILSHASSDPVAKDRRTRAQQLLHAMVDCAKYAARSGKLPDNGGMRPQLLVTVTLKELRDNLGSALVPHSGAIPVKRIRKTACDAGIVPLIFGARGEIIDVGRSQ